MKDLSSIINANLQQNGDMTFVDFMQLVLYHPEFGYYSAGLQKFGRHGDFITAPELTPLFGKTLANQCQAIFNQLSEPVLFEFGAGSGRLCVDILTQLEYLNCLPTRYYILEVSSNLQHRQKALIDHEIPHLAKQVHWLNQWPTQTFNGVIIANEVLDAMPVHRFLQTEKTLWEGFITKDAEGKLSETFKPCVNPRLKAYLQNVLSCDLFPYQSEANLFIDNWIQQCSNMLHQGAMILIDYGFPRHEYYHPSRNQGTIMCHYHHMAHTNPLLHLGEQDITAHVDFSHVATAANIAAFCVAGYTNQAAFLLANGLLSLLESQLNTTSCTEKKYPPLNPLIFSDQQAVKRLLQPDEMGELFKVMVLTKRMDLELASPYWYDKRINL